MTGAARAPGAGAGAGTGLGVRSASPPPLQVSSSAGVGAGTVQNRGLGLGVPAVAPAPAPSSLSETCHAALTLASMITHHDLHCMYTGTSRARKPRAHRLDSHRTIFTVDKEKPIS